MRLKNDLVRAYSFVFKRFFKIVLEVVKMSDVGVNKDFSLSKCGKMRMWMEKQHPLFAHFIRGLVLVAGSIVILIGILLLFLPGPGWLVIFLGLSIIGIISERVDNFLFSVKNFIKEKLKKLSKNTEK